MVKFVNKYTKSIFRASFRTYAANDACSKFCKV
jgi:hypothetical protein